MARAARVAAVGFGVFIAITSVVGIFLGFNAGEGWLAILYGLLGVSMGAAGGAAVWTGGAARGALIGWFLVGLASRALVEGDLYLSFISVPVAAALVAALAVALVVQRSEAGTIGAAAGGGLAILALIGLAVAAPSLPAICQPFPPPGTSETTFLYPPSTFPFDTAERMYEDECGNRVPPQV